MNKQRITNYKSV